jgi:hypothetical protein
VAAFAQRGATKPLLVCGRCENVEEIVLTILTVRRSGYPGLRAAHARGLYRVDSGSPELSPAGFVQCQRPRIDAGAVGLCGDEGIKLDDRTRVGRISQVSSGDDLQAFEKGRDPCV